MRNAYVFIALLSCCVLIFSGCEKDPAAGLAKSKIMLLSSTIASPNEATKPLWLEGDSIEIFSDQNLEGSVFLSKSSGISKVRFSGNAMEGEQFYGVYPYLLNAHYSNSQFLINLPKNQPASFWPMVGSGTKGDGIEFKGVGSLLNLKLTGKGNITSVKVEGLDATGAKSLLSGKAGFEISTGTPVLKMLAGAHTSVERPLNITLNNEAKKVYLWVPSAVYQSILISITNDKSEIFTQTVNQVDLSPEQIRDIDLSVDFSTVTPPAEPNLALNGLANCYVVQVEGDYYFPAKLVDNTVLTGDAADYLWTEVAYNWTNNDSEIQTAVNPMNPQHIIKNVSYTAQDGRISFSATGNLGNATIALYKQNAGVRTIVWSWHIWVSEKALDKMSVNWVSKNLAAKGQSLVWLDRNIGATGNKADHVGSNGMLYQWGRKDPFIGSIIYGKKAAISGLDEAVAFGELSTPVMTNPAFGAQFKEETSLVTVNEVAKNPMLFYNSSGNWATDISPTAWGDGIAPFVTWQTYMKGTDAEANYTSGTRGGSKSKFDPCPPGYRVPTSEELWLSYAVWTVADYPAWAGNVLSTIATNTNSHVVRHFTDPTVTVLFPAFGHREQGRLDGLGTSAYYQTSTINPANNAHAFRQLVGTNMRVEGSGSFAIARPVRCVAK